MQFRVPQNIAMEDRIVGPLTAIQFGILVVGGGLAFLIYTSLSLPDLVRQVGGGFFALLTVVLSIGKFNDQPMYRFFRFILAYVFKPKTRVWHKTGKETQLIRPVSIKNDDDKKHSARKIKPGELATLAAVLDSRGKTNQPLIKR